MKVYYVGNDRYPLYVDLDLINNETPTSFKISEIYCIDLQDLENVRDCITNGQISKSIGGGGNSYWKMWCENNNLCLLVQVSGSGEGCDLIMKIPCSPMLSQQFDKLVELRRCIERNEIYISDDTVFV